MHGHWKTQRHALLERCRLRAHTREPAGCNKFQRHPKTDCCTEFQPLSAGVFDSSGSARSCSLVQHRTLAQNNEHRHSLVFTVIIEHQKVWQMYSFFSIAIQPHLKRCTNKHNTCTNKHNTFSYLLRSYISHLCS